MKKVSVIIVSYNVAHFLEHTLRSVKKASTYTDTEIIVIDNASEDNSVKMVQEKFPDIKLIVCKKNLGFSRANNFAIKQASGEYILLLNPDTFIEENSLADCVKFMDDHEDAGALGIKMIDGSGNFLPESKRGFPTPWIAFYKIFGLASLFPKSKTFGKYHLKYLDKNQIHKIEVLSGAFMFIRKAALDKVGLLDEDFFMYGEDIDLSYRIIQSGYNNYYFPGTTIIHYKGESTKKTSINYIFVFYNAMIIFARKHLTARKAGIFSFLIKMAIYIRAGLSLISKFIYKIVSPLASLINNWSEKSKIIIAGNKDEKERVRQMLQFSLKNWQYIGWVNDSYLYDIEDDYLGKKENLQEIINNFGANEIIFCINSFRNKDIIRYMEQHPSYYIKYKMVPPDCYFILGSNYKGKQGDLHVEVPRKEKLASH